MRFVDTHAHLMDSAFDADRRAVLERAAQVGVAALLVVGYDLPSSEAAISLARTLPNARASVGIHPNSAAQTSDEQFEKVASLARDPSVVAIGETGLDNYRDFTPPARQRQALEWHLRLAHELGLPVIIHNRQADADIASALGGFARGVTYAPGVLHCFSSTDAAYLRRMLAAGFFVSFAGTLTYKTASDPRHMATQVPLDRLLVETDCPYLAPVPHRGRRNEPAFVRDTAACLADMHGLTLQALAESLWTNALNVFPKFEALHPFRGRIAVA
jgi:TatD DNase family protein